MCPQMSKQLDMVLAKNLFLQEHSKPKTGGLFNSIKWKELQKWLKSHFFHVFYGIRWDISVWFKHHDTVFMKSRGYIACKHFKYLQKTS